MSDDNNIITEEQKEFRELLQDLLMEQQEQMQYIHSVLT